jgi:hypothetical protein
MYKKGDTMKSLKTKKDLTIEKKQYKKPEIKVEKFVASFYAEY